MLAVGLKTCLNHFRLLITESCSAKRPGRFVHNVKVFIEITKVTRKTPKQFCLYRHSCVSFRFGKILSGHEFHFTLHTVLLISVAECGQMCSLSIPFGNMSKVSSDATVARCKVKKKHCCKSFKLNLNNL